MLVGLYLHASKPHSSPLRKDEVRYRPPSAFADHPARMRITWRLSVPHRQLNRALDASPPDRSARRCHRAVRKKHVLFHRRTAARRGTERTCLNRDRLFHRLATARRSRATPSLWAHRLCVARLCPRPADNPRVRLHLCIRPHTLVAFGFSIDERSLFHSVRGGMDHPKTRVPEKSGVVRALRTDPTEILRSE